MISRGTIAILVILLAPTSALAQDSKALLDFILAEQQKTYDALGTRPYRIAVNGVQTEHTGAKISREVNYEERGDGSGNLWGRTVYSGKDGLEMTFALNGSEFSHIPNSRYHNAYVIRDAVPGQLDKTAKDYFSTYRHRDFLRSGFLIGDNVTFAEFVELSPPQHYSWEVSEIAMPDGRRVYNVRRHASYMDVPGGVDGDFIIDPDRGYGVTRWVLWQKNGSVLQYCETDIRESEPGLYLPSSYRMLWFGAAANGPKVDIEEIMKSGIDGYGGQPVYENTFQYQPIEWDNIPAADLFTWKGLGVPDDINMIVTSRDGITELYVVQDGRLVPRDVVQSLQSAKLVEGASPLFEEMEVVSGESAQHGRPTNDSDEVGKKSPRDLAATPAIVWISWSVFAVTVFAGGAWFLRSRKFR